jgi:hypothetical protein
MSSLHDRIINDHLIAYTKPIQIEMSLNLQGRIQLSDNETAYDLIN